MAMEDAINRLASAVERNNEGAAVREIIRQRDDALTSLRSKTNSCEYWMKLHEEEQGRRFKTERRVYSLRGVITRMKKKAASK